MSDAQLYLVFDENNPPAEVIELRDNLNRLAAHVEQLVELLAGTTIDVGHVQANVAALTGLACEVESDPIELNEIRVRAGAS